MLILGGLFVACEARAELLPCTDDTAAFVSLSVDAPPPSTGVPPAALASGDEIAHQLAVGLWPLGIQVCAGSGPAKNRLAQVEIVADPQRAEFVIRVADSVTDKRLERNVDLGSIPADGRAVAMALYIEELLHASWAELALETSAHRLSLRAPSSLKRAVEAAQEQALRPRLLRLSLGASLTKFRGGLVQTGPILAVGYRMHRWLEAGLRFGYRTGPHVSAPHGTIHTTTVSAGVFVSLVVPLRRAWSLFLPQSIDASANSFLGHAHRPAGAQSATRPAVVVGHGAGLRVDVGRVMALSFLGRLSWVPLRAEAADDGKTVVSISGVAGEAELSLGARF